jgi:hypothetical protein
MNGASISISPRVAGLATQLVTYSPRSPSSVSIAIAFLITSIEPPRLNPTICPEPVRSMLRA